MYNEIDQENILGEAATQVNTPYKKQTASIKLAMERMLFTGQTDTIQQLSDSTSKATYSAENQQMTVSYSGNQKLQQTVEFVGMPRRSNERAGLYNRHPNYLGDLMQSAALQRSPLMPSASRQDYSSQDVPPMTLTRPNQFFKNYQLKLQQKAQHQVEQKQPLSNQNPIKQIEPEMQAPTSKTDSHQSYGSLESIGNRIEQMEKDLKAMKVLFESYQLSQQGANSSNFRFSEQNLSQVDLGVNQHQFTEIKSQDDAAISHHENRQDAELTFNQSFVASKAQSEDDQTESEIDSSFESQDGVRPGKIRNAQRIQRQEKLYRKVKKINPESGRYNQVLWCLQCGKKFAKLSNMRDHLKAHLGNRPYKCELCPRSFVQRGNRDQHQSRHASQCNKFYQTKQDKSELS